jgi:hypothetical protein
MRIARILRRESPLTLAQETLWRARRACNKKLLSVRLERLPHVSLRVVPYYRPALQNIADRSRSLIVKFADEIRAGRYPFLGYGTAELGVPPKWNFDFVSGTEWPRLPSEKHDWIRFDGADVKVPYELSRLQLLPILGKAHVLTGDDSYRNAAKQLVSHWIQANPIPIGVNWTIAMEAALRAMSFCFLLTLLSPFRNEEESWVRSVTGSLHQHLLYIESHNEFSYLLTSNHYLSNVVGLYCLSLFLEGQGMAARRREYRRCIEAEITKQVYDDGGDYEASTGYHALVTQIFSTALLLMRAENSSSPSFAFLERLRRMFRFLNVIANESGELPQVGDCDDGRVELLADDLHQMIALPVAERHSLRLSSLLGLGTRLFGEGAGHTDDAAWYGLTETTPIPYGNPRVRGSAAGTVQVLLNTGIGILQNGPAELLFFAMPNGIHGKGSHTHNDKLSFILRIAGQEIICDSGTGCYTRDVVIRNRFRSTAAHNTLRIDGVEQNRIFEGPAGLFMLENEAVVSPIQEGQDARGFFLRASHSGYRSIGVMHTRTIRIADGEPAFVIEDELSGEGIHDFEFNLQLAPRRTAEIFPAERSVLCCIFGIPQVQLTVSTSVPLQSAILPSSISTTYGAKVPASKVRLQGRDAMPVRITTRISWAEVPDAKSNETGADSKVIIRDAVVKEVCRR